MKNKVLKNFIDLLFSSQYNQMMDTPNTLSKVVVVKHQFEGEDSFWDELMDRNQSMTLWDIENQSAISFQLNREIRA